MRSAILLMIVAVMSVSVSAQQDVLRNTILPTSGNFFGTPCTALGPTNDARCHVLVYSYQETDAQIAAQKTATLNECQQKIEVAKGQLVDNINQVSPQVVETIKAQVKEEIKAEVIKELVDDIKSGKLKIPAEASVKKPR